MILVIDNYDSFTYNLVQYLGELNVPLEVRRNDQITIEDIRKLAPEKIVISPGPGTPMDGGVSNEVIQTFGETTPILGVCLGHQCIGHVYGGNIIRSPLGVMHGKTSLIHHNGQGLFKGLPNPFEATRYHSLLVERDSIPDCLEICADTEQGEIMGLRHKTHPVYGVQFHPESILTKEGKNILLNFIKL